MPAVARPQESLHRIFFNFSFIFWNLCLVVLGLCCCARAYSGCHSGSYFLLWHTGFSLWRLLSLQSTGSRCLGFSSYGSEARWWWCTGLVAPWCVDSSWVRYQIRVPCIGRQILNHWKGLTTLPNHQGNLTQDLIPETDKAPWKFLESQQDKTCHDWLNREDESRCPVGSGAGPWENRRPCDKALGLPITLIPASQHPGADDLCKTLGGNTSTDSDLNG